MVTMSDEEIEELMSQEPIEYTSLSEGPEPHELLPEDWPVQCNDPEYD